MYTCSISELAHRVSRLEENGTGGGTSIDLDEYDKDIVVPGDLIEQVDDIDIP